MKPIAIIALIVVLILPIGAYMFTNNLDTSTPETEATPTPTPSSTPNTSTVTDPADAISAKKVVLKTSKGDISITLFPEDAPMTVKNFVTLGKRGYYNGVTFHRVIQDFMIQGGDPTGTGAGGESIYGSTFPDEFNNHKIVPGSLAMANRGAATNSSQFFIVTETDQPYLDGKHTNFGQVDESSMATVRAIAAVPVDESDKPLEAVTITGFEIVQ